MKLYIQRFSLLTALLLLSFNKILLAFFNDVGDSRAYTQADDRRYIIVMLHRLGLSNRLRSLADWHLIASLAGRDILLSWKPTPDCNIRFEQLFKMDSKPSNLRVLREVLPDGDAGLRLIINAANKRNISARIFAKEDELHMWANVSDIHTGYVFSREIAMSSDQVIASSYDGILSLEGVPCEYFLHHKSQFLSSLVPNDFASNMVDHIMSEYFDDYIPVAIHLRVHDPRFDWAIIPPDDENLTEAQEFGYGASVDDFLRVMYEIYNKFSYADPMTGERKSWVRFFIASNKAEEKERLVSEFRGSISLSGTFERESEDGMQFAFLEWLLISKASLVINTFGSTFAPVAALRSLTKVASIKNGFLVHQTSINIPFCGEHMYAKYYSSQPHRLKKLTEGTIDNREVTYALLSLNPCNLLQNWGLSNVYCLSVSN